MEATRHIAILVLISAFVIKMAISTFFLWYLTEIYCASTETELEYLDVHHGGKFSVRGALVWNCRTKIFFISQEFRVSHPPTVYSTTELSGVTDRLDCKKIAF